MCIHRQTKCMPCVVCTFLLKQYMAQHAVHNIINLRRLLLSVAMLVAGFAFCMAAPNKVLNTDILSLRVQVESRPFSEPVISLGGNEKVTVLFDCVGHVYNTFTCHLVHCDAKWNPSGDLSEYDYMRGFNDMPITDYDISSGTTFQYTHYEQQYPNNDVELLLSGNYMVQIKDQDNAVVAQACFYVLDSKVAVSGNISGNTDIDLNESHQQLSYIVSWGSNAGIDSENELISVVMQNGRTDNIVYNPEPDYIQNNSIEFVHNGQLIFSAGSPFRRFEVIDYYSLMRNVERIEYFEPYYHATLPVDKSKRNYLYDQDQAGHYVVRSVNAQDSELQADYMFTHFSLDVPYREGGNYYISGYLTNHSLSPEYRMKWDPESKMYTATIPLKMGAYNYQYIWLPNNADKGVTDNVEGNFWQTNNTYQIFVYHRPFGSRYDQLIGFSVVENNLDAK